jgi:membrane protein
MSSPPDERRVENLRVEASREIEVAEANAERGADEALEGHARTSRALRITGAVLREQSVEQVGLAASGATFWLVISALPTAVAVVSLFGIVVSPERVAADLGRLANGAPPSLGSLVTSQLRRVAASAHSHLSLGLAVSLFVAVWSASGGVYNLDRAIRVAYGLSPQRYVEARARALVGAVVVVVGLGACALGVSVVVGRSPDAALVIVGVPILFVVITAAVGLLYRFSVGGGVPARALLPGAFASALGVVAVLAVFSAYADWSRHYTAVYGVFAGAVIGMLGTYLAVYVVLLGAVLNVQLAPATAKGAGGGSA